MVEKNDNQSENNYSVDQDEIDLVELIAIIFVRWKTIVIVTLVATLASVGYVFSSKKYTYEIKMLSGYYIVPGDEMLSTGTTGNRSLLITPEEVQKSFISQEYLNKLKQVFPEFKIHLGASKKALEYSFGPEADDGSLSLINVSTDKANPQLINFNISGDLPKEKVKQISDLFIESILDSSRDNTQSFLKYKNEIKARLDQIKRTGKSDGETLNLIQDLEDRLTKLNCCKADASKLLSIKNIEGKENKVIVMSVIVGLFLGLFMAFIVNAFKNDQFRSRFIEAVNKYKE